MNLHLVFEDASKKILGEVDDLDGNIVKARFLGEIVGDKSLKDDFIKNIDKTIKYQILI